MHNTITQYNTKSGHFSSQNGVTFHQCLANTSLGSLVYRCGGQVWGGNTNRPAGEDRILYLTEAVVLS
jgi:hypothetical protein